MLRRVLFAACLLGVLVLGLETGLAYLSQRGMEEALERQYEWEDGLRVSINSFPLTVSLLRNHIRELRLDWSGEFSLASGESEHRLPCALDIRMYDVELDMPAILRGRLYIRSLSRVTARMEVRLVDLGPLLGGKVYLPADPDGCIYVLREGNEYKYQVKVKNYEELCFIYEGISTLGSGLSSEPEGLVKGFNECFQLKGLPVRFSLLTVEVDGDSLVMTLRVEEWRDYLNAYSDPL